ncbi:hypothetical protein [Mollivirus kamchatka]|nr:hypothetical protein [Mollivirus kamchatka]
MARRNSHINKETANALGCWPTYVTSADKEACQKAARLGLAAALVDVVNNRHRCEPKSLLFRPVRNYAVGSVVSTVPASPLVQHVDAARIIAPMCHQHFLARSAGRPNEGKAEPCFIGPLFGDYQGLGRKTITTAEGFSRARPLNTVGNVHLLDICIEMRITQTGRALLSLRKHDTSPLVASDLSDPLDVDIMAAFALLHRVLEAAPSLDVHVFICLETSCQYVAMDTLVEMLARSGAHVVISPRDLEELKRITAHINDTPHPYRTPTQVMA